MAEKIDRLKWTDKDWAGYFHVEEKDVSRIRGIINNKYLVYLEKIEKPNEKPNIRNLSGAEKINAKLADGKWHFCMEERIDGRFQKVRTYKIGYKRLCNAIEIANNKIIPELKLTDDFAISKRVPHVALQMLVIKLIENVRI